MGCECQCESRSMRCAQVAKAKERETKRGGGGKERKVKTRKRRKGVRITTTTYIDPQLFILYAHHDLFFVHLPQEPARVAVVQCGRFGVEWEVVQDKVELFVGGIAGRQTGRQAGKARGGVSIRVWRKRGGERREGGGGTRSNSRVGKARYRLHRP